MKLIYKCLQSGLGTTCEIHRSLKISFESDGIWNVDATWTCMFKCKFLLTFGYFPHFFFTENVSEVRSMIKMTFWKTWSVDRDVRCVILGHQFFTHFLQKFRTAFNNLLYLLVIWCWLSYTRFAQQLVEFNLW